MLTRGLILLGLAVAVPMVAHAEPTPMPRPAAKSATPLPLAPGQRRITLSAEGNAIARKVMGTPDARISELQMEMNALQEEQLKLIAGPKVDVDKLEPVLRRKEMLQNELRSRSNDRMLALLRALNDADRVALLQNLANPAQLQNSKAGGAIAR